MLHSVDLQQAFKYELFLIKIMGFWNSNSSILYSIYKYLIIFILCSSNILVFIHAISHFYDDEVIDNLYIVPAVTEAPLKHLFFTKKFNKIWSSTLMFSDKLFQPRNQNQKKILENAVKYSQWTVRVYNIFATILCILFAIVPFLSKKPQLPIPIAFPFSCDDPLVFDSLSMFLASFFALCAFSNGVTDSFFSISMLLLGAQCDILSDTLRNLDNFLENDDTRNKEANKLLVMVIKHYQAIVR